MRGGPTALRSLLVMALVTFAACATETSRGDGPRFGDAAKTGELSLMIVGDYFHHSYALELVGIARALSPRARQIVLCTEQYRLALDPFLKANGVANVEYATFAPAAPELPQWARDIVVAGTRDGRTALIVSPDKHATSERGARMPGEVLEI